MLTHILTGGFLAGYRTYVIGAALAIQALAFWAVGDMTLSALVEEIDTILGGLGLMTLRAGVASSKPT